MPMRIMGLDLGSRTIGVAVSDELGLTAQGIKTLWRKSKQDDMKEILLLVSEFGVEKIVLGLPRNMDGSLGPQAEKALEWAKLMEETTHLPVETWDERLTTVGASRILLEADLSRKRRKGVIDKLAAVLILQGYLDHTRNAALYSDLT
jgi:putative holliday junction resolvase